MNSFEKLFVNSTNRLSANKNIILSSSTNNLSSSMSQSLTSNTFNNNNLLGLNPQVFLESNESIEQLQQRYEELTNILKEANEQKQMMSMLLDNIFKVQQGQKQKQKKRIRRKKNQLQSKFICNLPSCNKIYSSSASLVRHTMLKHAYCSSQPPEHNYLIPPSPNLKQTKNQSMRTQISSALESEEKDEEEGDAQLINNEQELYEADCQDSAI